MKKNFFKKSLAILLSTAFVVTSVPVPGIEIKSDAADLTKKVEKLLYAVNCGDYTVNTFEEDKRGEYQSVTEQVYGVDPVTGKKWGIVDTRETISPGTKWSNENNYAGNNGIRTNWTWAFEWANADAVNRTDTDRYAKDQSGNVDSFGSNLRELDYAFEVPAGEYKVNVRCVKRWDSSSDSDVYLNLGKGNQEVKGHCTTDSEVSLYTAMTEAGEMTVNLRSSGDCINVAYIDVYQITDEPALAYQFDFEDNLTSADASITAQPKENKVWDSGIMEDSSKEISYVDGISGKAVALNGVGLKLNTAPLGTEYSIKMWIKANVRVKHNTPLCFIGNKDKWISFSGAPGGTELQLWSDLAPKFTYSTDVWEQWVISVSNGNAKVYRDGQYQNENTRVNTDAYKIDDADIYLNVNFWNGSSNAVFDNVSIYNRALSAEEISSLYDSEKPVPVDKSGLQSAVDAAITDGSAYTPRTWSDYTKAIETAKTLIDSDTATANDVQTAVEAIENAEAALERMDSYINDSHLIFEPGQFSTDGWIVNDNAFSFGDDQLLAISKEAKFGKGYNSNNGSWVAVQFNVLGGSSFYTDFVIYDKDGKNIIGYAYDGGALWAGHGDRSYCGNNYIADNWPTNRFSNYLRTEVAKESAETKTGKGIYTSGDVCTILIKNYEGYYTVETLINNSHISTEYYSGNINGIGGIRKIDETTTWNFGNPKFYGIPDKTELQETISAANSYMESNYTAASWTAYQEKLSVAELVFNNETATQLEINTATADLKTAEAALEVDTNAIETEAFEGYFYLSTTPANDVEQTLCIIGGGTNPGAEAILWPAEKHEDHQWQLLRVSEKGQYQLINKKSNLAIGLTNDNNFKLAESNPADPAQIFTLEYTDASKNSYRIRNVKNKEYVSINITAGKIGSGYYLNTDASSDNAVVWNRRAVPQYTITTQMENGLITGSKDSVYEGESLALTVTPDIGYQITSIKVNGEEKVTDPSTEKVEITLQEIIANQDVVVTTKWIGFPSVSYLLEMEGNQKLNVAGDSRDEGAEVFTWPREEDTYFADRWSLKLVGESYILINNNSHLAATCEQNGDSYSIKQYRVNETNASQLWKLEKVENTSNTYRLKNMGQSVYLTKGTGDGLGFHLTTTTSSSDAVEWKLKKSQYCIVQTAIDRGTITATPGEVLANDSASSTITVRAEDGYKVSEIEVNGVALSSDDYSVDGDGNITITREAITENQFVDVTTTEVKVTQIDVTADSTTVTAEGTTTLTATVSPDNAKDKSVTWSSSDDTIATVNESGVVTGVKAGNVTITATANDGSEITGSIDITVNPKRYTITAESVNAERGTVAITEQTEDNTYADESQITLTATAADGYDFAGWYVDNTRVSTDNPYKVTVDADKNYIAKFFLYHPAKDATCTEEGNLAYWTDPDDANNTLYKDAFGEDTYTAAEIVTPVIAHNYVIQWGDWVKTEDGYTRTAAFVCSACQDSQDAKVTVEKNITNADNGTISYIATAELQGVAPVIDAKVVNVYHVIASSEKDTDGSDKGTVLVSGKEVKTGIYEEGTVVTVTAQPVDGYVFDGWYEGDACVDDAAENYEFTVAEERNLVAHFAEIKVTKIDVTGESTTVTVGNTTTLTATVSPEDAKDKSIIWSSSDEKVATVNESGVVTGVKAGNVTITATAKDGSGVFGSIDIEVVPVLVETITISGAPEANVNPGYTATLQATVMPENATDKTVAWTSDNEKVVTVDEAGNLKALAAGTATITATAKDGSGVSAQVIITVVLKQFTITASAEAPEMGSVSGAGTYDEGTDVTLTATANKGYRFLGWYEGENLVSEEASYTFNVDKDCALVARFEEIKVTKIEVSADSETVEAGSAITLTAIVLPDNAKDKTVTWSSSDENVATVDVATGEVTGVKAGTVTITATANDGSGIKGTVEITVTPKIIEVSTVTAKPVDGINTEVKINDTLALTAVVLPEDAEDKSVIWKSANETIATVDENGVVTGVAEGDVVITATSANGVEGTILIRVKAEETWYTVTVTERGSIQGDKKQFKPGERVTVVAEAPAENEKFIGWKNAQGEFVCYASTYTFPVEEDTTLTPFYSVEEVEKQLLLSCKAEYIPSINKIRFTGERLVPADLCGDSKLIGHGIILTTNAATGVNEDNFVIGGTGVVKSAATNTFGFVGTYQVHVKNPKVGGTYYARTYVTYVDSAGTVQTKYSKIIDYTHSN